MRINTETSLMSRLHCCVRHWIRNDIFIMNLYSLIQNDEYLQNNLWNNLKEWHHNKDWLSLLDVQLSDLEVFISCVWHLPVSLFFNIFSNAFVLLYFFKFKSQAVFWSFSLKWFNKSNCLQYEISDNLKITVGQA